MRSISQWLYGGNANGSMVSGDGRTIGYAVMGKPVSIVRGSATATLYYGPDRTRYKRIDDLTPGGNSRYVEDSVDVQAII